MHRSAQQQTMRNIGSPFPPLNPEVLALVEQHGKAPEALLPIFPVLQARYGSLTDQVAPDVARALGISIAHAQGLASFYALLSTALRPPHTLRICDSPPCWLHGAAQVRAAPVGSCRLCVVEVDGWRGEVTACTQPVGEGMVVRAQTPALERSRRMVLEPLLRHYHDAGYAADDRMETEFDRWVRQYQAQPPAGFGHEARYRVDSDPTLFVWVDLNKCILRTRCVRACAEIQGRFVWGIGRRAAETKIIAGYDTTILEAPCESCSACVTYCPTRALDDKRSVGREKADTHATITCPYCGVGCTFAPQVKDGKLLRVTPNPSAPVNGLHLCVKGRYGYDFVHHPERLTMAPGAAIPPQRGAAQACRRARGVGSGGLGHGIGHCRPQTGPGAASVGAGGYRCSGLRQVRQ